MTSEYKRPTLSDVDEVNEKQRREILKSLAPYGNRPLADLPDMSDGERTKWLFWNLHENLDEIRKHEPALVGQVIRTQLTVSDGQSMWAEKFGLERRIELSCKWQLMLKDGTYQNEQAYSISEGWVDLYIGNAPPPHPILHSKQKGYLDADSALYPNQLFLYGWIAGAAWEEIKPQLHNASANCHTDIFVRDNFMFAVKPEHSFVNGPPGSIGITNLEFRVSSQPRLTSWVNA